MDPFKPTITLTNLVLFFLLAGIFCKRRHFLIFLFLCPILDRLPRHRCLHCRVRRRRTYLDPAPYRPNHSPRARSPSHNLRGVQRPRRPFIRLRARQSSHYRNASLPADSVGSKLYLRLVGCRDPSSASALASGEFTRHLDGFIPAWELEGLRKKRADTLFVKLRARYVSLRHRDR